MVESIPSDACAPDSEFDNNRKYSQLTRVHGSKFDRHVLGTSFIGIAPVVGCVKQEFYVLNSIHYYLFFICYTCTLCATSEE